MDGGTEERERARHRERPLCLQQGRMVDCGGRRDSKQNEIGW